MYQWQSEFGAGLGDIGSKFYVDVLSQVRLGFTFLYTGKACGVDDYPGLNRFKRTDKVIDRFKIHRLCFNTSKRYTPPMESQSDRIAVADRQSPVEGKQPGASRDKYGSFHAGSARGLLQRASFARIIDLVAMRLNPPL